MFAFMRWLLPTTVRFSPDFRHYLLRSGAARLVRVFSALHFPFYGWLNTYRIALRTFCRSLRRLCMPLTKLRGANLHLALPYRC